ncbi:serine hydrolase [Qipengyuania flava]|uniref:serine hydrolase n=1 Tax=Qipengyuania flava TaxID=192812 RepID=UPI001C6291E1|nr:serine hydrolase [Qipengyuania flava]QYJ06243.1 serine hydrolase [Qipengyuania flava]
MTASFRFLLFGVPLLLLALLVVWLPALERRSGDPLVEQAETAIEDQVLSPAQVALDRELSRIGGTFPGHTGIAVRDIAAGETLHFNGLEMFPQQSVSKLWVAMTALEEADEERLDLAERVEIRFDDLTVFYQPIRNTVRRQGYFVSDYADLIDRAITQSDNTANDRILRRVGGPEAVQDFLDQNGLSSIRFGTDERTKQSAIAGLEWRQAFSIGPAFFEARDRVPEARRREAFESYLADPVDGAPPVAIAEALGRLARGDLLSPGATATLLSTLERTKSGPNRLKAGAPEGWVVRHKTGTGQFYDGEQSGYNDVGLITSPEGRTYAVVVMIARTRAPTPDRMAMMQEVVRAAVRYDAVRYADRASAGSPETGAGSRATMP